MDLSEQLKNIYNANLFQMTSKDDQCVFDLYNLMRRIEEFFEIQSEII